MERIQKGAIGFITTVLASLLILSACGPEQTTPTTAVPSATPERSGLELDATFIPFPTRPVSGTATLAPAPEETAVSKATATTTEVFSPVIVADIGFRPNPNGFSFENYAGKRRNGKPVPELTMNDMIKMFGDADVCIKIQNGKCTPREEAVEFLNYLNSQTPGGHCEGMAVWSLILFKGIDNPADYQEGAENTFALTKNEQVQSMIAYYYYLQYIDPVSMEYYNAEQVNPSEVLDRVIASMQSDAPDPVNLGFYGGAPDSNGNIAGHSITPYAVEDRGNGIFWIYVYDNNWPDNLNRYMQIDRVNETWSYDFSAQNPDFEPQVWAGDADTHTLSALPISWRTGTLWCPWCEDIGGAAPDTSMKAVPGLALTDTDPRTTSQGISTMQISLDGSGQLLIENSKGQRIGFDGGKLVSEIPGARVVRPRTGLAPMQPVFFVPKGEAYNINLTGEVLPAGTAGNSTISLFGQGVSIAVQDIALNQGDVHKLTLSSNAQNISFVSGNSTAQPTFRISTTVKSGPGVIAGGPTSYQFQVGNINLTTGQQLDLSLNKTTGQVAIKTGGTANTSSYDLDIVRTDTNGSHAFKKTDVKLNFNDTHKLNYGGWTINGVAIDVDQGSTGKVDATQPVPTSIPTETPQP